MVEGEERAVDGAGSERDVSDYRARVGNAALARYRDVVRRTGLNVGIGIAVCPIVAEDPFRGSSPEMIGHKQNA